MGHRNASHGQEPIRLFRSDVLEFFTHIHPAIVAAIYGPAVLYLAYRAIVGRQGALWHLPVAFVLGLGLWTLAEYLLHRFLFHFRPRSPRQERLAFLFHGVHHAQPRSKTRLVMPPAVSIPLAALFYGLFWAATTLLGAGGWLAPLFGGFLAGYLAYDMTHYSLHHAAIRSGYLARIRGHHMRHHGQTPNQRFGVTSDVWDRVFGTLPRA